MNDVYLRDTSRKVKQTLNTKRNNGKCVACPPYGYRKAERTTDQLVPDENTAPVVKMIFDLAAHFMGGEHQGQRRYLRLCLACRDPLRGRHASPPQARLNRKN